MEIILNIALELAVLTGLALLYYFYQRHRILHGPRNWKIKKLVELHKSALSCTNPDDYPEIHPFLDELENLMNNQTQLDQAFLDKWRTRHLPEHLKQLLTECWEWSTYTP